MFLAFYHTILRFPPHLSMKMMKIRELVEELLLLGRNENVRE
jgi:hypothetical protein